MLIQPSEFLATKPCFGQIVLVMCLFFSTKAFICYVLNFFEKKAFMCLISHVLIKKMSINLCTALIKKFASVKKIHVMLCFYYSHIKTETSCSTFVLISGRLGSRTQLDGMMWHQMDWLVVKVKTWGNSKETKLTR